MAPQARASSTRPEDPLTRWLEADDLVTALAAVGFYTVVGLMVAVAVPGLFPQPARFWALGLGAVVVVASSAIAAWRRVRWYRG